METYVETFAFFFLRHAQADDYIDHLEDDEAADTADNERRGHGAELHQHVRVGAAYILDVENAGQQGPDDAADAVDSEGIERVVVAESPLDRGRGEEAENTRRDADHQRTGRADKTGRRCDRDR